MRLDRFSEKKGYLDVGEARVTMDLLEGFRRFDHPTLLVWAKDDPHFGSEWGERLRRDIPGAVHLELLPETGHLLMEERPERFAALVGEFLAGKSELKEGAPWPNRETS